MNNKGTIIDAFDRAKNTGDAIQATYAGFESNYDNFGREERYLEGIIDNYSEKQQEKIDKLVNEIKNENSSTLEMEQLKHNFIIEGENGETYEELEKRMQEEEKKEKQNND